MSDLSQWDDATIPEFENALFASQRGRAAVQFLTRIRLQAPELWAQIVEFHERISGSAVSQKEQLASQERQQALPEQERIQP